MFPTPSKKGSGALVKEKKKKFLRSQDVRMSKAKNENVSAAQKEITLERYHIVNSVEKIQKYAKERLLSLKPVFLAKTL